MKKLLTLILTTLMTASMASSPEYCGTLAGTWTQGDYLWSLKQTSGTSQNLTGTMTDVNCGNGLWNVMGTFEGNNQFNTPGSWYGAEWELVATFNSGGTACQQIGNITLYTAIPLGQAGCGQSVSVATGNPQLAAQQCLIPYGYPYGESSSSFTGWDDNDQGKVAFFNATLNPPGGHTYYNYSGRTAIQQLTGNISATPCVPTVQTASAPDQNNTGTWYLTSTNDYAGAVVNDNLTVANGDRVGLPGGEDTLTLPIREGQIRGNVPSPCYDVQQQSMAMDCPNGTFETYEQHLIQIEVDLDNTIEIQRNEAQTSPIQVDYGLSKQFAQGMLWFQWYLSNFPFPHNR